MSMKKLFTLILCVTAVTVYAGCRKGPSDAVKIGAILSITGPAAYLGAPESRTAQMLVDEVNEKGGINGKPVELIIKDSEGNPEKAISFAKQLIEEEKVFAIIGPSTSGETMKIKTLCDESKMLLLSCAAAEVIVNPVAKFVFKTPQKDSHVAKKIFETMKKQGILKIGIISDNTGFGAAGKEQLEKIAPEYGITVLISEVYNSKATDLTGVLAKLKGQNVQAVINWSIVPAQAIVAKNMKQIKLEVPLFQSHGFGNLKYAEEAGKAGDGIIFPVGRLLVADQLPDANRQKALLQKFKKDYETRYKEDVSAFGGYAYDALIILFEGMKKAGVNDRDKVRDAIEQLKGVPGASGVFSLSPQDHNGLGMDSLVILTVKDGKFVPYEKLD
jgi:branched-chain amino acid transport system substrate-binding protein